MNELNSLKYDVLIDTDLTDLTILVSIAIESGWNCQGGIFAITNADGIPQWFCQAIVKNRKDK